MMEHLQDKFARMQGATNLGQNERIKKLQKNGEKIYHLGFGQSPFPVPVLAQEALKNHVGEAEYVAVKGVEETRQAICQYHERIDGFKHFTPDDVIIGPGSKELIFWLMYVVRGDVYLLAPTWTTYKPQSFVAGKKTHVIKTKFEDGWKLTPSALEAETKNCAPGSLLVLCNPDNPTGACYTEQELEGIASVVRKANLLVVCDEIYARLKFNGKHHSLVSHIPERAILSSGISKWASCGGWRLGYHMYPKELNAVLKAVEAIASNSYSCCSTPVQHAARYLLAFGKEASDYAKSCARILAAVAKFCADELKAAGVKVNHSEAGYYIFPDFGNFRSKFEARGITTGVQMCDAILKETKICLLAGGPAFLDDPSNFTVRLCYVNFDGGAALQASASKDISEPLTSDFVKCYCKDTVEAIHAITTWLKKL